MNVHIHKAWRDISSTEVDHITFLGRKETIVNRDNPTVFYGYCSLLEVISLLGIKLESRLNLGCG